MDEIVMELYLFEDNKRYLRKITINGETKALFDKKKGKIDFECLKPYSNHKFKMITIKENSIFKTSKDCLLGEVSFNEKINQYEFSYKTIEE